MPERIQQAIGDIEIGKIYTGKVSKIIDFGAFTEQLEEVIARFGPGRASSAEGDAKASGFAEPETSGSCSNRSELLRVS